MLRKSQFIFFTCQKLILAHFCKLTYKDRDLWWPNKYRVACFSQFIPAKVKKILRKSQPQIHEKLRKLSFGKEVFFFIKNVYSKIQHLHHFGVLHKIEIYSLHATRQCETAYMGASSANIQFSFLSRLF